MVRKTKEEALATRSRIIDAAEHVFNANGVSRTTLSDIASAAGLTRGAIYWHFKDKSDLFNAMMDRVCLPMEDDAAPGAAAGSGASPLTALRAHLLGLLTRIAGDPQVQRVFDIATHKIEYVDELSAVRERHLSVRRTHTAMIERTLRAAQRSGEVRRSQGIALLAIGLQAMLDGLLYNWMLDRDAFDLVKVARRAIDVYLDGLRPTG